MGDKEKYKVFCTQVYVPVFSKPWWMDAVCGTDNWDVWLYEKGNEVVAAMPYYTQIRDGYKYITKAPLTQNNGLLIKYPKNQGDVKKSKLEEEIVLAAVEYIESIRVDVYEQQYHYSFQNYLPFFWEGFDSIPRVTYVLKNTGNFADIEVGMTSNYRNTIRKGRKNIADIGTLNCNEFYRQHEKIYKRQGVNCPFSLELWIKLYEACRLHEAGRIYAAKNDSGDVLSLSYIVYDEKSAYLLMGGAIPEYSSLQTYSALVYQCIKDAMEQCLDFDFEGSVIRRINHSFREYGGKPMLYYRIRKVFNSTIIKMEAERKISQIGR